MNGVILRLLFICALNSSPAFTDCPIQNIGFYGGGSNTVAEVDDIRSWQQCGTLCHKDSKCHGWTYYTSTQTKYPSYKNWCYLKDSSFANFSRAENGLISGEKDCYEIERKGGADNNSPSGNNALIIAVSCSMCLLILILCTALAKSWYEKRFQKFGPQLAPHPAWKFDFDRSIQSQVSELPYNLQYEFPRLDVTLVRIIGEGNFGEVWEAMAEGIAAFRPKDDSELMLRSKLANLETRQRNANDFWVKYFRQEYYPPQYSEEGRVAIKRLKPGAPKKDYTDLACELKLMIHLGAHKNIVNLMGACTRRGPLWVILEYCPYGDLRKYLRTKSLLPTWNRLEMTSSNQLCIVDLMRMSMEIAEGMIFLSMSGIVHRDLAARNVLVGSNMEMKIADFGMARDVGGVDEEYNKESEAAVPVRWTAPEALSRGIYTTSSDVWSYGVLLWEIFSIGSQPYTGCSNYEVKILIERKERMEAPTSCPDNIYLLMKACWNHISIERPDFLEIFELLLDIRRLGFAPSDDYYTGTGDLPHKDDIYESNNFVDCRPILRDSRIKWLKMSGVTVTDENVEELLNHFWGGLSSDCDENYLPSLKTTKNAKLENVEVEATSLKAYKTVESIITHVESNDEAHDETKSNENYYVPEDVASIS